MAAKHPPQLRADALALAQTDGADTAAAHYGINPSTIRRWARTANLTLPGPRKTAIAKARTAEVEATATATAARAQRLAGAQAALPGVVDRQAKLTEGAQGVALRITARTLAALGELTAAEGVLENVLEGDRLRAATERRDRAASRLDAELERARKAAIAVGIHVDKLLKLAGEDSTVVAPQAAGPSAAVTLLLASDPGFRDEVAGSLLARYQAIETSSAEAPG